MSSIQTPSPSPVGPEREHEVKPPRADRPTPTSEPRTPERERFERRQVDQDRTLEMMQALEAMLARPSPGREASWHAEILGAIHALEDATAQEEANALRPDGLLSDLATHQPRLRNRVRGLRAEYRQLRMGVAELRRDLEHAATVPEKIDIAEVRSQLGGLLSALRHQRAKESDLIYEAYYDAFRADLPRDADRDGPGDAKARRAG